LELEGIKGKEKDRKEERINWVGWEWWYDPLLGSGEKELFRAV